MISSPVMYYAGMVYTTGQACKKLGIPLRTLKSRMTAIAKSTGKQWRLLGRNYYVDDKELALLGKVPPRGSKPKAAGGREPERVAVPDSA